MFVCHAPGRDQRRGGVFVLGNYSVTDQLRARIIQVAESYEGTEYGMPPDGVTTLDCSLYVLEVYAGVDLEFTGIRTAEQIRQACTPLAWEAVQAGDLLFFEHT